MSTQENQTQCKSQTQEQQQLFIEQQQRRFTQRLDVPEGEERHNGVVTKFSGTYGFAVVLGGKYNGQTIMINQSNILTTRENVFRNLNNGEHIEFTIKENDDGRIQALSVSAPGGYCLLCETNPNLSQRRYPVRSVQGQKQYSGRGNSRGRGVSSFGRGRGGGQRMYNVQHKVYRQQENTQPSAVTEE